MKRYSFAYHRFDWKPLFSIHVGVMLTLFWIMILVGTAQANPPLSHNHQE